MGEWIKLTSADGFELDAYLAQPEKHAKGALVVLQEIFGVNAHIRDVADRFAKEGFMVVAPSTFARVKSGIELGYDEAAMQDGIALKSAVEALPGKGVVQDIQAAVDFAGQQHVGKVGVTGFCWGGLLTWRSAELVSGLSAAVTYYGGGMTGPDELTRQPKVPVMAHFGTKDHWISLDSVSAFEQVQPSVQVHVYEADHGFNCDPRAAFDATAADLAWQRTVAFFSQHLSL
ncbi:dienelactone hydrolase family protein [Lampropedia puyangensis]|uniref:Dienelactone hydrolase family protein n=1 Tax=Lampropedia puyangensis TaxID=1330072 RepID=A0A4S8EU49_9BURK|nr:dienelactone hydrolase family protein [Lampropedia puyangensis]THT97948.1 dienelactone hydrolase family protein [Lampropedia puyangensis]